MAKERLINKQSFVWATYDCGNSAWALTVLAVLFPVFLGTYWSGGGEEAQSTTRLAWTNSLASLVVFVAAPVLGTIADNSSMRKRFLAFFAIFGSFGTLVLAFLPEGAWFWALACFGIGSVGYYGANVFYDSLLVDVTTEKTYNFISSLGYALGYVGGALLLAINVWMMTSPETFGLADQVAAVKASFITVGIWWIIFLLPTLLIVKERGTGEGVGDASFKAAYRKLAETMRSLSQYRDAAGFLLAYLLYIAGVFTVIAMGVNFGQRLGFSSNDLVKALLITNFVGFPATILVGVIGHYIGAKNTIYICLSVYIGVAVWAGFLEDVEQFYYMAVTIGLVQGGAQGMSRSLYASLIPAERSGEFFGFYNMLTKLAHVVGPMLVGIVTIYFTDPKFILLALIPLFVLGMILLGRVPREDKPEVVIEGGRPREN